VDDEQLKRDVWALRLKLAESLEHAGTLASHKFEWDRMGIQPHHWPEVSLARLEALEAVVWAHAKASLDALLAVECLRAQVAARTDQNGVEEAA
jgi:hypothetical protein